MTRVGVALTTVRRATYPALITSVGGRYVRVGTVAVHLSAVVGVTGAARALDDTTQGATRRSSDNVLAFGKKIEGKDLVQKKELH